MSNDDTEGHAMTGFNANESVDEDDTEGHAWNNANEPVDEDE